MAAVAAAAASVECEKLKSKNSLFWLWIEVDCWSGSESESLSPQDNGNESFHNSQHSAAGRKWKWKWVFARQRLNKQNSRRRACREHTTQLPNCSNCVGQSKHRDEYIPLTHIFEGKPTLTSPDSEFRTSSPESNPTTAEHILRGLGLGIKHASLVLPFRLWQGPLGAVLDAVEPGVTTIPRLSSAIFPFRSLRSCRRAVEPF